MSNGVHAYVQGIRSCKMATAMILFSLFAFFTAYSRRTLESVQQHKYSAVKRNLLSLGDENRYGSNEHGDSSEIDSEMWPSKEVSITVATAASESDLGALLDMLTTLREYSGKMRLVLFDIDLSDQFKTVVADKDRNMEIRKLPVGLCRTECKAQMVHSLLDTFSIIIWADIGNLPSWDLRLVLEEYPVGTSFVGLVSNSGSSLPGSAAQIKPVNTTTLVSTAFFILFPNVRFYYRVLLPWVECRGYPTSHNCAAQTRVGDQIEAINEQSRTLEYSANYYSDAMLTILLLDYQRMFPESIILREAIRPASDNGESVQKNGMPVLPYVSDDLVLDKRFIAFVTRYGPNNQMSMTYESAGLAWKMNARVLLPPIATHHVQTNQPGVSARLDQPEALAADRLFTAHFIYRNALLADTSSSWAALLPTIDFMTFQPLPGCLAPRNCSVRELMNAHPTIHRFFRNTGLAKEAGATLNIVRCKSHKHMRGCLQSALSAGGSRNIIAAPFFWQISGATRARGECAAQMPLPRASPFAVQSAMLVPGNAHGQACVALQLRLLDTQVRDGSRFVNNVPEAELADVPAFSVLMRAEAPDTAAWHNTTLLGVIAAMRDAAAQRGLHLYVLMPFHQALFDAVAQLANVTTARALSVVGRSDLEVLLLEMALAAGCRGGVVLDPSSSLSVTIAAMRGGEGLLDARLAPLPDRAWC
jgi:hypothetical protein